MITFSPQCTLPGSPPAFIQQPNVRSTMDIIWSSLMIIILCSWSILHLNIPPQFQRLPPAKSLLERSRRKFFTAWFFFRRKLLWMLLTIFVPECVLSAALATQLREKYCTKRMKAFQREAGLEDEILWTPTHTMYANMGGYVLKFPQQYTTELGEQDRTGLGLGSSDQTSDPDHDIVLWPNRFWYNNRRGYWRVSPFDWHIHPQHFSLAQELIKSEAPIDHFRLEQSDILYLTARSLSRDTWTLTCLQLLETLRFSIIEQLPNITESEILDKSKSDVVVTLAAVCQIAWLVIQLITRTAQGRQSSQIEITALAFAACAVITYWFLFRQPKDIHTPTVILATRCPTRDEFKKLASLGSVSTFFQSEQRDTYAFSGLAGEGLEQGFPEWIDSLSIVLSLTIFGSVHLLAWNMEFPTEIEHTLWQVSAAAIASLPAGLSAFVMIMGYILKYFKLEQSNAALCVSGFFLEILILAGICSYLTARLYHLVEALRSTYYLPPSSYIATWASNIPHVA